MTETGKVTGIGGLFFKTDDVDGTKEWYRRVLGIQEDQPGYGILFPYDQDKDGLKAYSVFSLFKSDTDYLKPGTQEFMLNFRVSNLENLIEKIKAQNVDVEGPVAEEGCGKFAWIVDPNGIKLELWEQ
ncbi:VOC family protein [Temperatibacter marinus]|uniref:VOC family protein n=1 Tax=Temperatibacter marinus TaxID=1456591 RepID=A0AA52HA10_9PROT|nr:VOC family protein [Temperatibacter marinus]WND02138.1 VOC family protein [Temperatibacter marinus]